MKDNHKDNPSDGERGLSRDERIRILESFSVEVLTLALRILTLQEDRESQSWGP